MADITWTTVIAVAKDLATGVPVEFQDLILAYVNDVVAPAEFGGEASPTFVLARAYLAAHYGAVYKLGGFAQSGQVTSMSEGGVSQSFSASAPSSTSPFGKTAYGESFLSLVRRSPANAGFVT